MFNYLINSTNSQLFLSRRAGNLEGIKLDYFHKRRYSRLPLSRSLGISNISLSPTKCSVPPPTTCYESTLN